MDIPVPTKIAVTTADEDKQSEDKPVNVTQSSDQPNKEASAQPENLKPPVNSQEDAGEVIASLISSKKYFLPIKEKRTKPLLDFSLGFRRKKKSSSKKHVKKQVDTKKPQSKKKKIVETIVICGLWIGLFIAIDMGVIDIGWKPPFSLFNRGDNQQILNFSAGAEQ